MRVRCLSRFWPCGALAAHFCHSSQEAAGASAGASAPAQFREETPLQESCDLSAEAAPVAGDLVLRMVAPVADCEVLAKRAKGDDQERNKQQSPDHGARPFSSFGGASS